MKKGHLLAPRGKFRQSAYLQQTALFLGQQHVFADASDLLKRLSGIDLSDKQIEHLCHHYGEQLECESIDKETLTLEKSSQLHYAMVDGSYLMSREEKWTETKLGRIFQADDCLAISDKRSQIRASKYVAHIGGHQDFCEKFSTHLDRLACLVFIADGAVWIWKWIQDFYPQATAGRPRQILDFFHAYEKLCQCLSRAFQSRGAVLALKEKPARQAWLEEMKALLLNNEVEEVIIQIQETDCKTEALEKKTALLSYFENNRHRMQYKTYRQAGYLIGSGPIESANRKVIQTCPDESVPGFSSRDDGKRMKRSGQRWTLKGGQQVLNLRTANLSQEWDTVISLVRNAA